VPLILSLIPSIINYHITIKLYIGVNRVHEVIFDKCNSQNLAHKDQKISTFDLNLTLETQILVKCNHTLKIKIVA